MAGGKYNGAYTGAQIDEAIGKALNGTFNGSGVYIDPEPPTGDETVWIDTDDNSGGGAGGGGGGGNGVYISPDEPTNGETVWYDTDDQQGGFYTKKETEALVNSVAVPFETGTWTPIFGYAVETTPATYTTPTGHNNAVYTKIGNLVYVSMYLSGFTITNAGSGTGACIKGLPFVPNGSGAFYPLTWETYVTTADAALGSINHIYKCFYPVTANATNLTWKQDATVQTSGGIRFAAVYTTDE